MTGFVVQGHICAVISQLLLSVFSLFAFLLQVFVFPQRALLKDLVQSPVNTMCQIIGLSLCSGLYRGIVKICIVINDFLPKTVQNPFCLISWTKVCMSSHLGRMPSGLCPSFMYCIMNFIVSIICVAGQMAHLPWTSQAEKLSVSHSLFYFRIPGGKRHFSHVMLVSLRYYLVFIIILNWFLFLDFKFSF